jgi:alpha-D-xyloside xylohydrolase
VRVAQSYVACGEAYWNADIGAFFVKQWNQWFGDGDYPAGKDDLGYRELYTRWIQFAGFTPFMRSHGTDTPREVWQFGERGTMFRDAIEEAIALRYRLAPYFYSLNAAVTFEGTMPITALALAYPHDRTARAVGGQYLYGHELMICPVTHPMYYTAGSTEVKNPDRFVDIYLPEGGWYDFYTEEYLEGGRFIRVACDITRIPIFVRAGAILPTSPVMPYVDADPTALCEVKIYAGSNGQFTLYNDAGDGYGYEEGDYTAVTISYDNETGSVNETWNGVETYRRRMTYRIIGR